MISIARTFGAPVIEPPGNAARSKIERPEPVGSVPQNGRHQMLHELVRLPAGRVALPERSPAGRRGPRSLRSKIDDHHVFGPSFSLCSRSSPANKSASGPRGAAGACP